MPFGLTPAPEEFQRRQHQVLERLPGVLTIHDDILLYEKVILMKKQAEIMMQSSTS